jgi:hypothetical protein
MGDWTYLICSIDVAPIGHAGGEGVVCDPFLVLLRLVIILQAEHALLQQMLGRERTANERMVLQHARALCAAGRKHWKWFMHARGIQTPTWTSER